jgi:Tol biopolymer transport system component
MSPRTGHDIWVLPLDLSDPDRPKPGTPQSILATAAAERYPAFSPDGRWLAYTSDESGAQEVYVRQAAGAGGKWQVSASGGVMPMWSRDGRQIFFESSSGQIMVAEYEARGDSFLVRNVRVWSPVRILDPGFVNLDLAPDGKRFAVFISPDAGRERKDDLHVTFLFNFFDDLRRRLPSGT